MKYVLYNNGNGKYIKADARFKYTEIADDALEFSSEELANNAMVKYPEYDIMSQVIMACYSKDLTVIEIDSK